MATNTYIVLVNTGQLTLTLFAIFRMSIVSSLYSNIRRIFLFLFKSWITDLWFKLLCWKRRHPHDSDSILPIHVNQSKFYDNSNPTLSSSSFVVSNYSAFSGAGGGNLFNFSKVHQPNVYGESNQLPPQASEEEDYFRDMAPSLIKQKRIVVPSQSQEKFNQPYHRPSKLSVDLRETIEINSELGILEDSVAGSSWEDEANATDLNDLDQSFHDARQQERTRRIQKHQMMKMARESKKEKGQKSNLLATKIG